MQTFRDLIRQKDFVVTASPPLRPSSSVDDVSTQIEALRSHVDAIQVYDSHALYGHMSGVAVAAIARGVGVDTVVHINARDRNLIALQTELLDAAAAGVTTLVLSRGESLPDAAGIEAREVHDIGAIRLLELATKIGNDSRFVSPPGFFLGSVVTVFKPAADWNARNVNDKIDAGAAFGQTQACLNVKMLKHYLAELVARQVTHKAAVLVDVPLLTSADDIASLQRSFPNAQVLKKHRRRIVESDDPIAEGIALCAETLVKVRNVPGVSGANIIYHRDAADVVAAIATAGFS